MYNFFLGMFVFVSVFLIFLIMIQHGKDSDLNTSLGLARSKKAIIYGNNNTLTCITSIFAFLFFLISLIICNMSYNNMF
ncbi:MAG: preprotein translocase subunit SecG [Buchnera aphidicola (Melaphis rhois)]